MDAVVVSAGSSWTTQRGGIFKPTIKYSVTKTVRKGEQGYLNDMSIGDAFLVLSMKCIWYSPKLFNKCRQNVWQYFDQFLF